MGQMTRIVGGALAVVLALAGQPACGAVIDLKVIGISGWGSFTDKSATVMEDSTVTVGVYLANVETLKVTGGSGVNGIGGLCYSVRSFGETSHNGEYVFTATDKTPTWSVVNAVSAVTLMPAYFNGGGGPSAGALADLSSLTDPEDADVDLSNALAGQTATENRAGFGVGPAGVLVGAVTFRAMTLPLAGDYSLDRRVELNIPWSASNSTGGLSLWPYEAANGAGAPQLATQEAGFANPGPGYTGGLIGANVVVTVTACPEPGSLGVLALGVAGVMAGRRGRGWRG